MKNRSTLIKILIALIVCLFAIKSTGLPEIVSKVLGKVIMVINENGRPRRVRTAEELAADKTAVYDFIGIVGQFEGYKAAEYNVTTSDGYILRMHRLYASPYSPEANGKKVVLINQGILTTSDFYVCLGPDHDLAYKLADNGYDVWFGNIRGTSYSLNHVSKSHTKPGFWKFSLNEAALIDAPTFIDFVLDKTGQKDLTYIGYSMGTTEGFMLLSSKLEYNKKVNMFICIAPVAYFVPPLNPVVQAIIELTTRIGRETKVNEIVPQSILVRTAGQEFCSLPEPVFCIPIVEIFAQYNKMNISHNLPEILKYFPAGVGYHIVEHYDQMIQAKGKFQAYDYGELNLQKYNQRYPPQYNVSLITAPTFVYYGLADSFTTNKNARILVRRLRNLKVFYKVRDRKFNHLDFFWNLQAPELVYTRLINDMNTFLNQQ